MAMSKFERGFTLVELAIVVALLGLFAVAALPSVGNLLTVLQAKGVTEQVASAIRQTRQLAITAAEPRCIALAGTTYEITRGACPGTTLGGPVGLSQGGCFGGPGCSGTWSFTFTPESSVDPVGPTTVTITTFYASYQPAPGSSSGSSSCTASLTVTPSGGVTLASPPC